MTTLARRPNVPWIVIICLLEYTIANDVNALTSNEHTNQFLHPNDGVDKVDNNPSVEKLFSSENNNEDANKDSERKAATDKLANDQNFIEKVGNRHHEIHSKVDAVNNKNIAKEINDNPTENVVKHSAIEYDRADLNELDVGLNKNYGHFRNNYVNHDYGRKTVGNYPGVQIYPISYGKNNFNEKYIPSRRETEEIKNKDLLKSKWDYTDITTIYLAGYDDQIFKLMYDIQKHGAGTELLVYFYIYNNNKYCNIGYFYTNRNILRKCIANYSHYFCLDNNCGTSCLESLGIFKPNEISNIPMDSQKNTQNIAKLNLMNNTGTKEGHRELISNNFYKLDTTMNRLKEYYPAKQSSDVYEFILPREHDVISKDIYINLHNTKNPKADENLVLENDNINIKQDNRVNLSDAVRSDTKTNQQETNCLSGTPSELNIETSAKTPDGFYNSEDVSNITSNDLSVYETASQGINHGHIVIEFLPRSNLSDNPKMQEQSSSYKGQEYNKLMSNTNMLVTEENLYNNKQNNIVSSPGQDSIDTQNSMLNDTDFLLNNNAIVEFNVAAPCVENTDSVIYTLTTPEHGLKQLNVTNDSEDSRLPNDKNLILNGIPTNRTEDSYLENLNILNDGKTAGIMPNTVKIIINQGYEMDIEQNNISQSSKVDSPILENNNIIVTVDVEPHIDNSDDATGFTPEKATYIKKSNPDKHGLMDGMASVIPDIDLINQKPINVEDGGSLDYSYVSNMLPPECSNVTKSDEMNIETQSLKTGNVSESPSETIEKSTKPNDVSVPKLDTKVEKVPRNFVVQQPFNNVNYQLLNTNQCPHSNPWSLQFEGISNQNQPIFGDVNQNKKLPAYWPLNILQKTLKGIYDYNKLDGNIHDANLNKQSYIQNTNFQTTTGSPKYEFTLNSLKALLNNNNIVKYLEPTPNRDLIIKNVAISLPINYHTTHGKKIINALHIPDSCVYKNILTLENNVSPNIATVNSPISNDSIYKKGLVRDNYYFNIKANVSTNQLLNELPICKKFDVYLTNLPHTRQSLLKNMYTDTKSNEIPLKIIPIPISRLSYNDKFYQNINEELKTGGKRISAIDTEKYHTAFRECVLKSINKYDDYNSPIHHTLKPTSSITNDKIANNAPETEMISKPILNYIDEKTQIPAKYNSYISDGNLLRDPQRDKVQFHDFPTTSTHIHYSYDNILKTPFKYNLIPLKYEKDALGALTVHESLLNKDKTSSSKFWPYSLKPSYFTGSPVLPVNWHPSLPVTTKPSGYPFFSHPVARMSALNPLVSLRNTENSAYIPSPSLALALKPSHYDSVASANPSPDQSFSFTNPPKLAYHQSPGLPISQKSAYHQYHSFPVSQMSEYYPFHLAATSLFGQPNRIKFATSPKYQLSAASISSTSAQIGENTNEANVPQNNILAFNDGYDVNSQPRAKFNKLDSLALKPSVNSLTKSFSPLDSSCRYVNPYIIDSTHLLPSILTSGHKSGEFFSPSKNTVLDHAVCSSTSKSKGYNSPFSLSMPQQEYNLMQSSSSLANNINSYRPIFSSQNQIYPYTSYLRPDVKYTEVPLYSHSKSSIPKISPNLASSNVFRFHPPTSERKFNKAPNLNLISPVSFASDDKVKTLSPITKPCKTLASPDTNMYKTYPYLPCAIHADSKSNLIEKPQKMYSTIFNPLISTLQPAASSPDSPNSMPYNAKLSSIKDPRNDVSFKSNTLLTEPDSLFFPKKLLDKTPYTGISTNFPFVPSSLRLISSSYLPSSTCNIISSYPYLSQTSSITQNLLSENHATLPCSNSPYSCSPLDEITWISPWKSRTQNSPSENVIKFNLYGTLSNANFLKNRDSFGLPSQETYTDPLKFEHSSQGTNVRLSPVNQYIKLLNVPLSTKSTTIENSSLGLLPQNFDKLPNDLKTPNTEVPSILTSMFSVKPEESATLTPNWVSPYASLLQSRDTLVPESIKNQNIPSPVDLGTEPCSSAFNTLYYPLNLQKYTSYIKPALQENLQNIATVIPFSQVTPSKLPVSLNIDTDMPYDLGLSTTLLPSTFNCQASLKFPSKDQLNMRPLSPYTTFSSNSTDKITSPVSKQNLLNILIPKYQSTSYSSELGTATYLPGRITNKFVTPSTTFSTSSFALPVSTILQQPHSFPTDSSVYDYSFNIPPNTKMTPESKQTVFKTIPQIEQTMKNAANSPNSFITNENIDKINVNFLTQLQDKSFDLHHRLHSVSRSYLGDNKKTIDFLPSPNIKAAKNPLPSSVYSPFGSLALESLSSRTQKPEITFTTDSGPSKLFKYPSIPNSHTSMFEDEIPSNSESISLNSKPSPIPIYAAPFISQSNIPCCETISSTQSSKPFDKNLNTYVSRYLPFNYSPYSTAKYLPNNYQASDSNNLNTFVKPLKYGNFYEKKEIINPIFQKDTTLPNLETMANIKVDYEAMDKINNNINKYIRQTLLPHVLNENTIIIPLQNTCIAKCNPNNKVYYIKTENPDIELKVWPTEIQLVKAKIVFENEKLQALNFCPVVKVEKPQYSKEVVQNIVENYVKKFYGEPIVVKSCNIQKPYEFVGDINESFIKNDKVYIVWSNICDC